MKNKIELSGMGTGELRYTANGLAVYQLKLFGITTGDHPRRYAVIAKALGEKAEALADSLDPLFKEGMAPVLVRGFFRTNRWEEELEGGEKAPRSRLEIRIASVLPLHREGVKAVPSKNGAVEFLTGAHNVALVEGRFVRDLESREIRGRGGRWFVTRGVVAVNEKFTAEGEEKEVSSFIPFEYWARGPFPGEKGNYALIAGEVLTDSWVDQESNERRYRTYIRAQTIARLAPLSEATTTNEEVTEDLEVLEDDLPF